ncbi:MAG: D-2-hydroxyacid dehydrogenase [Acutalibacteraceae bacterium]
MLKIVLPDCQTVTNGDLDLSVLERFGSVQYYPLSSKEQVAERICDADIVLCNKSPMTAETLRHAEKLRYIGLFATGYNNIDLTETNRRGITVCNAGSYSTEAVVQHTFALILHHFSCVSQYDRFVQDGRWVGSTTFSPFVFPMQELAGKTLGIIGFGSIGRAVARVALAFSMRVLCFTRTPRQAEGISFVPLETLLAQSDIVSIHCPLNESSRLLFNDERFALMKPGAYLVNTARGPIIDEPALRRALESGRLSGAAIDVLETEPMLPDCPLIGAPNLTMTPHVAWAPLETRARLLRLVAENLEAFLAGTPQNVVTE